MFMKMSQPWNGIIKMSRLDMRRCGFYLGSSIRGGASVSSTDEQDLQIVGQFDIPILVQIAIRFDKIRIVGQNFGSTFGWQYHIGCRVFGGQYGSGRQVTVTALLLFAAAATEWSEKGEGRRRFPANTSGSGSRSSSKWMRNNHRAPGNKGLPGRHAQEEHAQSHGINSHIFNQSINQSNG
jgi:hypothetical protein